MTSADHPMQLNRNLLRIGWFTTANGPGSRGMFTAVLDAIKSGELTAKFEFVFVSRERGQTAPTDSFMDLVEANDIPLVTLSSLKFRRANANVAWDQLRDAFDRAILAEIVDFKPDVCVMAGFMLFTPGVSRELLCLNQHPALPGGTIGKWQDAIWDVIESDEEQHGSMVHIATPKLDRGPVATFCRFPIRGSGFTPKWEEAKNQHIPSLRRAGDENLPLFAAIREAGVKRERPLVVETLKAVANREVDLNVIADGAIVAPIDMTDRVESALSCVDSVF